MLTLADVSLPLTDSNRCPRNELTYSGDKKVLGVEDYVHCGIQILALPFFKSNMYIYFTQVGRHCCSTWGKYTCFFVGC